ncbi:MAG: DNA polymerase [Gemmataceae bacterium]
MPLNYLFVDMNSYFASVEQQLRPQLRGKPVAVVPVCAETTCCIAASYEAKAFGVKTGTRVSDARALCPGLCVVEARPKLYVQMHHRIKDAIDSCIPVDKVMSVDEMICKLQGHERTEAGARELGMRVKRAIYAHAGVAMRCSVGVAPNRLIAKVAADMHKPDGLTVVHKEELPQRLYGLKPTDIPGIGPRMDARLRRVGVTTVETLCRLTPKEVSQLWGSQVVGGGLYHKLRGEDLPERPTRTRSMGHSRVLPPNQRHDAAAWAVLVRLIHKVAARLRAGNYWTGRVSVHARYLGQHGWDNWARIEECQDTLSVIRACQDLWSRRPPGGKLLKVGVVLADLVPAKDRTRSLFEPNRSLVELAKAMDQINRRFGLAGACYAGMHGLEHQYTTRIAFNRVPDIDLADA